MAKEEILKQIYLQALHNRQENLSNTQPSVPEKATTPSQPAPRAVDRPDTMPQNLNEREQLLHELIGVYRSKRKIIDDLPPKHRVLLEKLSRLTLGVPSTKQPPGGH